MARLADEPSLRRAAECDPRPRGAVEAMTLRPAIIVKTSPGAGRLDVFNAGVTPVMACVSKRLFTANRTLVADNFDVPPTV